MEFYHDFSVLGLKVLQRGGIYPPNQAAKAPIVSGYLLYAIGKLKTHGVSPLNVAELFCADAFYSFLARRFGADRCEAFDNDRDGHLAEALEAKRLLDEPSVTIHQRDIYAIPRDFRASIVINTGGLYHVADPIRALELSYAMTTHYLIVQSVVSLATESEDYFETPAPGLSAGCRFSYAYLARCIQSRGYKILDTDRNILTGNDRLEDRGSAYFLIERDSL